ncbi:MAG TPA: AtpZ/AtpI family protein [Lacipirellula sp.]
MAAAMQWVARIFAAALMMSLPGLGGQWLDRRFGTSFIGLAGFALGVVGGMMYLIAATRSEAAARKESKRARDQP